MELGILDKKAFEKVRDNAPDGAMTYKSYYQLMSWCFHISKTDSKGLLKLFKEKGLIQYGRVGFKIIGRILVVDNDV